MKVICTDGTSIQCDRFRAIDSGILLFEDPQPDEASPEGASADEDAASAGEEMEETDEDAEEQEAIGFVPSAELRYVLPDEAQPASQRPQSAIQQGPSSTGPGSGQRPPGQAGRGGPRGPPRGPGRPSGPRQ